MKVICSYCRNEIEEKKPFNDERVSYGICKSCYEYYLKQIKGLSFDEYLDRFDVPVVIVDDDVRILALNRAAKSLMGKSNNEVIGLLGGEAMECAYARLPEGCGNTIHCLTCSIRNTVTSTMNSGEPQIRVPVKLHQEDQDIEIFITTQKIGKYIRVKIEDE